MMNIDKEIAEAKTQLARYEQQPAVRLQHRIARLLGQGVYRDPSTPVQDHYLTIEWAIQEFWAREISHHLPAFNAVHEKLMAGKYTQRKPFIWNDLDNSAYLFRSSEYADYATFVIDTQSLRYYYYLGAHPGHRTMHARSKRDSLTYGDCRDKGFLFSLEELSEGNRPPVFERADYAHARWSETYWALWWVFVARDQLEAL